MQAPLRTHAPQPQRGAVGVFGVLALGMTILFAVLTLDTGRLALEKRRLQEIADVAAIDAVRTAGVCSGAESMDAAAVSAAAQQSALRNGYTGDLINEAGAVQLGRMSTIAGLREFTETADAAASAVQVTARKLAVQSLVAGGWYGGTVALQATGVAVREPRAGFSVGSFFASVDSEDAVLLNSVLGELLGSAISVDALHYNGLVNAELTLAQLIDGAAVAGVGLSANTVEGLLEAELTVAQLLSVTAAALDADGDATATAAAEAATAMAAAAVSLDTFRVGDLLNVSGDDPEQALQSRVNAYALGTAALQLARKGETVHVPIEVSLPLGIGSAVASIHVTEAPRPAVGLPGRDEDGNWKTMAHTGQLELQLDVPVSGVPILPFGLDALNASALLSMRVEAASADAWLANIDCARATTLAHRVTIGALPRVATLSVGPLAFDITLLGGSVATITVAGSIPVGDDRPQDLLYSVSEAAPLPRPVQTAGTPLASALGASMNSLVVSLELNASGISVAVPAETLETRLLSEVLDPVLNAVDEEVLDPVLRALGVGLGGADVRLVSLDEDKARLVR